MINLDLVTDETLATLDPRELAIFKWQYHLYEGFYTALWEAIKLADEKNLERIRRGFPDEIDGYIMFSQISGWWPEVERKAQGIKD